MKKLFLICSLLCFVLAVNAQQRSFGTLPLVNKPGGSGIRSAAIEDTVLLNRVSRIYDRLVQARGDFRFPVPSLTLKNQERSVAFIDYGKMEVTLEHKAIQVCEPYGDPAIAFLLGHELSHFYEKHAWRRGFVADHKDLQIGMALNELTDDAANETEADYLGGFLAYSAGYGVFDKGPDIIKDLYAAYDLPVALPGYPSLADRQELSRRSAEKIVSLVEMFEMANYLTAIGRYTEAFNYYRQVLMDYQSREIYNNLGVTAVLDAMEMMSESEKKYRFPLQLDLESMATRGSGMVTNPQHLIKQAILHFDAAISLDPNYAPAYLNKACAYALLGDHERATFYAEVEAAGKTGDGAFPKTAQDARILMGIIHALKGENTEAKAILSKEAAAGSALAEVNLQILEGRESTRTTQAPGLAAAEKIDGFTMAKITNNITVDDAYTRTIDKMVFHQNPSQGPESVLYVNHNTASDEYVLFHFTKQGYTGKTNKNIAVGSSLNDVLDAYGEPKRILETPQGQVVVYPKMLFVLGKTKAVEKWATYAITTF